MSSFFLDCHMFLEISIEILPDQADIHVRVFSSGELTLNLGAV